MSYTKEFSVNPEHIDFQGIMDGLYYPYYMEECRHSFVVDEFGKSLEQMANEGVNFVLAEYTIKFKGALVEGDHFEVTCKAKQHESGKPRVIFQQEIRKDGKLVTQAEFSATCVPAEGGRPFIPEFILEKL